jgi:hypothetical protein
VSDKTNFNSILTRFPGETIWPWFWMFYSCENLGYLFKQQDVHKIDHVVDVACYDDVTKTAIFRTPTCHSTAANTPGTHINRISAQSLRNHLGEGGLHGPRPYVGCLLSPSSWRWSYPILICDLGYRPLLHFNYYFTTFG